MQATQGIALLLGPDLPVRAEWTAFEEDERHSPFPTAWTTRPSPRRQLIMYGPIVDIAVGPFGTDCGHEPEYLRLLESQEPFILRLLAHHAANVQLGGGQGVPLTLQGIVAANANPRCFFAIEIEHACFPSKYLLGSATNAMALGKVGLLVAWDERRLAALLRVHEYLSRLRTLEKNVALAQNLLVLTRSQLLHCLDDIPGILWADEAKLRRQPYLRNT